MPGPEAVAEGRAVGHGVCFSAPPTADFGPGLEEMAEGRADGRGVAAPLLSPPTSGLGRRRWRSVPSEGTWLLVAGGLEKRDQPSQAFVVNDDNIYILRKYATFLHDPKP